MLEVVSASNPRCHGGGGGGGESIVGLVVGHESFIINNVVYLHGGF